MYIKKNIPPNVVQLYRKVRSIGYMSIIPFDAIFRNINRMGNYPPIHLRRHVSLLGSLDGPGYEFVAYLKLLTGLKSGQRLWDVGCGCGLLELALEQGSWRGSLIGVDIHKPSIEWAQSNISRRIPEFQFVHADIYNQAYAPNGKKTTEQWLSAFAENNFDVIIAKSLFTHMLPDELTLYFEHISARLQPTGKALLTFYLLNEEQEHLTQQNKIRFIWPVPNSKYAVKNLVAPTAAVAYCESYLLELLAEKGLQLSGTIRYGAWSGRKDALSYQDIAVVERKN